MPDSAAPGTPAQRMPVEMTVVLPVRKLPQGAEPVSCYPAGEAHVPKTGEVVGFGILENGCLAALRDRQKPVLEGLPSGRQPVLFIEPVDAFRAIMDALVARVGGAERPAAEAVYDPLLCCRLVAMLDERWLANPFDPYWSRFFHTSIRTNRGDEGLGDLLDSCAGRARGWWKASEAKQ